MNTFIRNSASGIVAATALAFGVSACGGSGTQPANDASTASPTTQPASPSPSATVDFFTIVNDMSSDMCMEALVTGTLQVDEQGCLVLAGDDEVPAIMPLLPKGSQISDKSVTLPDGTVLEIGKKVSLGGGFTNEERFVSKARKQCNTSSVYVVCHEQG
ncbi:hypothetical protein [Mobiluncus curtisii]|uniref:hypothetical protein n=1 Tax=Mobiluncus curtisii TaxID=2051 RepID=UPI000561AEFC|nr:hypothetical protein [Mobiluncus curtisii]QQT12858.1 hypothetical protein I6I84_06960 [Mobiluncus curtisii]STY77564.1 Uncharacterised protein [Mobiluncus curtisii subsp. curtisii]